MAIKLDLSLPERWETVSAGGASIELLVKPMTYYDKMRAADLAGRDLGQGMKFQCEKTIRNWKGVEDVDGRPIAFGSDSLNRLLAADPTLGEAVVRCVLKTNGHDRKVAVITCPECGHAFVPAAADPTNETTANG